MARPPKPPPTPRPEPPNVHRRTYLAIREILADKNPDEVAQREWLKRRLDEETAKIASIPRKLA